MPRRKTRSATTVVLVGLVGLAGCEEVEQVADRFRDLTPYEAYQESLTAAGLAETALGRDWLTAGRAALEAPAPIALPFEEEGFIAPEEPGAMAYRVTVGRGQRLTASVELTTEDETRVFVDLFRVAVDDGDPPRPVFSSDSLPREFAHEPWRGGEFVLRIQPELLRGGRYRVTLRLEAQLAFPVDGVEMRAVQSLFGAQRDGGRRSHDGVDIFARRGTPVLAASAGVVNRVGITNLGGKVVWVRDPARGANIYYAHLDSQLVANGVQVQAGDTLGFVGNTGNARTTPPHLHFGVYRRGEGPIDPVPFLRPPNGRLEELTADVGTLGRWVRLRDDGTRLREAPDARAPIVREMEEHTPLRVLGGSGEYFRVRLPDGSNGYVAARLTESVEEPVASQVAGRTEAVRDRPEHDAPVVETLDPGTEVAVLGRFAGYLLVMPPTGRPGWLADEALQQQD